MMKPQLNGTFGSLLIIMWLSSERAGGHEIATNKVSGKAVVIPTLAIGTSKSYFPAFINNLFVSGNQSHFLCE
jgi:hypothetical protein